MPAHIHLIRHAQGHHNLTPLNHSLPDPLLTPLGLTQCSQLMSRFPYTPLVTHIVASPLRRTLYTALESFSALVEGSEGSTRERLRVIALPEIQETSGLPCDTGSSISLLQEEFGQGRWKDVVDFSLLKEDWNDKSASSPWAPAETAVEQRAHKARLYLRKLADDWERENAGEEAHIIVVTHGGLLHFLTEDWCGYNKILGTGWENSEFRTYTFKVGEEAMRDGVDMASFQEKNESLKRRQGRDERLTADEERELRAVGAGSGEMWMEESKKDKGKGSVDAAPGGEMVESDEFKK